MSVSNSSCVTRGLLLLCVASVLTPCIAQMQRPVAPRFPAAEQQTAPTRRDEDRVSSDAVAEADAAATMVDLTVKEAVRLALLQSPAELLAKLEIQDRRKQVRSAVAALLPTASSLNTAYLNRYNLQEFLGPYQVKVAGNENATRIGPYQVVQPGATFSQQILNLPDIRRVQAAREDVRTSEKQLAATREQLVAAVVEDYQRVLRAVATEAAAEAREKLAERLLEQASQQLQSGIGTGIDELRAKVELANEQQHVSDAHAAHREAVYELTDLLDLRNGQEARPTENLEFNDLPVYDRQTQMELALSSRPELAALRSQQRAAHRRTQAARAQRWPVLAFDGSFAEQGRTFNQMIPAYKYAGTISFPLLDGGRISIETDRSRIEEERLTTELERTQSEIRAQVKTAFSQLEAARYAVGVSRMGIQLAEQEVAQASRRTAAGVASNIEVTTAQDQLARANDNQIDALFRFNQARAALARATGTAESVYGK